jgi:magnesium transporter
MLKLYALNTTNPDQANNAGLTPVSIPNDQLQLTDLPADMALWIDLFQPTAAEIRWVEQQAGLTVPSETQMMEIESSSRLYRQHNHLYATIWIVAHSHSPAPIKLPLTLIANAQHLITLRYDTAQSLDNFLQSIQNSQAPKSTADIMFDLLEAVIDRAADILETTGLTLSNLSHQVFANTSSEQSVDYNQTLKQIGRGGTLIAKLMESLLSLERFFAFLRLDDWQQLFQHPFSHNRLDSAARDVGSLHEHAQFLDNRLLFVLDATLGLINLQQNNILKIFTVLALIFMPPTLIAGIYGMNFHYLPELGWKIGYPLALLAMLLSAMVPYALFKRRGWLK